MCSINIVCQSRLNFETVAAIKGSNIFLLNKKEESRKYIFLLYNSLFPKYRNIDRLKCLLQNNIEWLHSDISQFYYKSSFAMSDVKKMFCAARI